MKHFLPTLWFAICVIFCTVCITVVVMKAQIDYECKELGLLQIGNDTYDCEPKQPLVNESEDFK